jgi:hypothetical protein
MVTCDSNNTSIQQTSWEDHQYNKFLVFFEIWTLFNASKKTYRLSQSYAIKLNPLLSILFFSRSGLFYDAVCTSNYTDSTSEM